MDSAKYRVVGEWKGDWKSFEEAVAEFDSLCNHEMFSNTMWWIEDREGKEVNLREAEAA